MRLTLREWIIIAIALLFSAGLTGLSTWYLKSRLLRISTVDMRAILQAKQRQVGDVLIRDGVTAAERNAAIGSAAAYGTQVERILEDILQNCRCVLVSKDLVVPSASVEDHTASVFEQLSREPGTRER